MSRITIPHVDHTPSASLPLLEAVNRQLGVVPNLMKVVGNSSAALEGYLSLSGALGKGSIGVKTSERIAMAVAELNGCAYCLSAHHYLGSNLAKLDAQELDTNRHGNSTDPKAAAALRFTSQIVATRGHVSNDDLAAVKAAGYSEAEVIEIVLLVALNTLTNYVNNVAQTDIDFPVIKPFK
jgi:uncharacterized peroxidase-related enzyme